MPQFFILRCEEAIALNTPFTATVNGEQQGISLQQCQKVISYRGKLSTAARPQFDGLPIANQLALGATVDLFATVEVPDINNPEGNK
ncbi:hypothetical protein GCM10023185_13220 [Hymenobacter saemangeumensis]|uniref:Uncharacterized protein n=1 Tax=Hymenobacter saemangeumensis TaxID=1084522 RepID=A0ABP8I7J6_9BACT